MTATARTVSALVWALCLGIPGHALAQGVPAQPTPEDWVQWGSVVHGGFGSHIALGIRIGQDALHRLQAQRREVQVWVTEGPAAPCPCLADGLTVATSASAGQRSLAVLARTDEPGLLAKVVIEKKSTHEQLTYKVPASAAAWLQEVNASPPIQRLTRVLDAPASVLYTVLN